jgi:hypothetical protein
MTLDLYKHPKWQQARLRVMERDHWKCVACDDAESTLHVHHFYYDGNPWDVADEFLQTLCEKCHGDLGTHPKGGLFWHRQKDGKSIVAVCWCPICGSYKFRDKGGHYKCISCGWNTSDSCPSGFGLGEKIEIVNEHKQKPKEYSLGWLKGMITKIRKGGATDLQIFEAIFPDSPAVHYVEQLIGLLKTLSEQVQGNLLSHDEEEQALSAAIKTRREIASILLKVEAKDGR